MFLKHILMILIKLHFIQNTRQYYCFFEICLCCGGSDVISNKTRLVTAITNVKDDNFNMSATFIKEFNTIHVATFHQCTGHKYEQFRQPNYYPILNTISLPFRAFKYQTKVSEYKGFQKCLVNYCQNKALRLTNMLICEDNSIVDFHIDYADRLCMSNITFIRVISDKITTIGSNTSFFNQKINWNVAYLQLDLGNNIKIDVKCNSFKYLKSLRVVSINRGNVKDFKCLFEHNPDLVKITAGNQRIWNMCDNNLEFWDENNTYTYISKINDTNWVKIRNDRSKGYDLLKNKDKYVYEIGVENRTKKIPEISAGYDSHKVKDETFVKNQTEEIPEISTGYDSPKVKDEVFVKNQTEEIPEISTGYDSPKVKDEAFVKNQTGKIPEINSTNTNGLENDNPNAMFSFYLTAIFLLIFVLAFGISKC